MEIPSCTTVPVCLLHLLQGVDSELQLAAPIGPLRNLVLSLPQTVTDLLH